MSIYNSDQGITFSGYLLKRSNKPYTRSLPFEKTMLRENLQLNFSYNDATSSTMVISTSQSSDIITSTVQPLFDHVDPNDMRCLDFSGDRLTSHQSVEKDDANIREEEIDSTLEFAAAFFGCDLSTLQTINHHSLSMPPSIQSSLTLNHNIFTSVSVSKEVTLQTDTRPISAPIAISTSSSGSHSKKNYNALSQSMPEDFIDPKDGHIWRAKFCILENGILYFYKNFDVGNSSDAKMERHRYSCTWFSDSSTQENHKFSPVLMDKDTLGKSPLPRSSLFKIKDKDDDTPVHNENHVIWEKRVPLDMVGAVRAAEADYGERSFELLAIRTDDRGLGDCYDDLSLDDRLILRASSVEDMNSWMLRFKESCALIMKQLVRSFKDEPIDLHFKRHDTKSVKYFPSSLQMPHSGIYVESAPTRNSINSPLGYAHEKGGIYRRRSKVDQHNPSAPNVTLDQISTVEEQSQVDNYMDTLSFKLGTHYNPTADSQPTQNLSELQLTTKPAKETLPSTAKYIPPHLRPKKTSTNILMANADSADLFIISDEDRGNCTNMLGSGSSGLALSLLASMEHVSESDNITSNIITDHRSQNFDAKIILGGCADPNNIDGSICDHIYIPRSKSKVGKAISEHYSRHYSNSASSVVIWEVGAVSDCGIRDSNEDAYLIVHDLRALESADTSTDGIAILSIFDGHCGNHTARFASERLPLILIDEASKLSSTNGVKEKLELLLKNSISRLDSEFCELCTVDGREWDSGATAIIVLMLDNTIAVATLGDSNGVFGYSTLLDEIPEDEDMSVLQSGEYDEYKVQDRIFVWKEVASVHSPGRDDERLRIEAANGWITTEQEISIAAKLHRMDFFDQDVLEILERCFSDRFDGGYNSRKGHAEPGRILHISRLCGELAVSRALGDRDFKAPFHSQASMNLRTPDFTWKSSLFLPYPENHPQTFVGDLVSAKPDISFFEVGKQRNEFLVLASDGLWDVMDCDDVVRITKDLLFTRGWSSKKVAIRLAELAVHLGSSDNVTVLVALFYPT